MADSYVTHTGDGTAGPFSFSALDYLSVDHLVVKVDGVTKTLTTHYTVSAPNVTFTSGNFPASPAVIKIQRDTPRTKATRVVDFADGAVLTEADLDNAHLQNLFIGQEAFENTGATLVYDDSLEAYTANSKEIKVLADPTTDGSAVHRKYVTDVASFGVPAVPQQHNETLGGSTTIITLTGWTGVSQNMIVVTLDGVLQVPGTDFTITAAGSDTTLSLVGAAAPASGTILNVQNFGIAKSITTLGADSVDSSSIVAGAIDLSHLNQTGGSEAVNTAAIRDDAVTSAKIADDSVDFARLKDTGFVTAPGGSIDQAIVIAPSTGNISTRALVVADVNDFNSTLNARAISGFGAAEGNVVMGDGSTNYRITNMLDPTSAQDAATKTYVDTLSDVSRWSSNSDVAFTGKVLDVNEDIGPGTETLLATQAVSLPSATSRLTGIFITVPLTSVTETLGGSNDPAVKVVFYPRFYTAGDVEITSTTLGYSALPTHATGSYASEDTTGAASKIAYIAKSDNAVTIYGTPWGVSGLYNLSAGGTYDIATVKVYALTLTSDTSGEGSETVTLAGNINVQHTHKP